MHPQVVVFNYLLFHLARTSCLELEVPALIPYACKKRSYEFFVAAEVDEMTVSEQQ